MEPIAVKKLGAFLPDQGERANLSHYSSHLKLSLSALNLTRNYDYSVKVGG